MQPFSNIPINIAELPRAEEVPLQPLHPAYLTVLRIEWLITAAILIGGLTALFIFSDKLWQGSGRYTLPSAVFLFLSVYYFLQEKGFPYHAYAVREKDVLYQKGWLVRSLKACPYNRIQNCTVQSGPLERRWGLATLKLFTAGSSGADMRISGLTQEEADNLRQAILTRIQPHAAEH